MKKAAALLLILVMTLTLNAENFVVQRYDITIHASEDSSLHVKETILVDFTTPSHGIYRDIQYRFSNPNGNFADPIIASVSGFTSSDFSSMEKEDGYMRFYLGDGEKLTEGEKEYTIEYDYALGRDVHREYDELYYNLISPAWDTPIWNITWSVTFPKEISKERIEVKFGEEGSETEGTFTLSPDRKRVSGERSGLMNYGALTLRVLMDEGYWSKPDSLYSLSEAARERRSRLYLVLSALLSLMLLATSFLLWFFFGREKPFRNAPSPSVPDNLSPMEVRYILEDGKPDGEKDLISMLLGWAEQGYVKIIRENDEYTIIKLEDLPSEKEKAESNLFSLLFKEKKSTTFRTLMKENYEGKYRAECIKALSEKYSKGEKRLKSRISTTLEGILLPSFLILSVADGVLASARYPGLLSVLFTLLFVILCVFSLVSGIRDQKRGELWSRKKKNALITALSLFTLLIALILLYLSYRTFLSRPWIIIAVITDTLSITSGTFISSHVEQKSAYGHDIYERCLNLRTYLKEYDEKDISPSLYPYLAALGFTQSRNTMETAAPMWYEERSCHNEEDSELLWPAIASSMSSSYRHEWSAHLTDTHSSGSGSSSGGGFSGGGGGSW